MRTALASANGSSHHFVVLTCMITLVIIWVIRRPVTALVITGVNHRAAVVEIGRIVGDQRGQERARKVASADEVLVQIVTLRARRFEDQLVLEKTRFLGVQIP